MLVYKPHESYGYIMLYPPLLTIEFTKLQTNLAKYGAPPCMQQACLSSYYSYFLLDGWETREVAPNGSPFFIGNMNTPIAPNRSLLMTG